MINTPASFVSGRSFLSSRVEEIGEVCIANISSKEREIRKRVGIVQFVFTLVALAALIALDMNPLWRLLLFFMFSAATTRLAYLIP